MLFVAKYDPVIFIPSITPSCVILLRHGNATCITHAYFLFLTSVRFLQIKSQLDVDFAKISVHIYVISLILYNAFIKKKKQDTSIIILVHVTLLKCLNTHLTRIRRTERTRTYVTKLHKTLLYIIGTNLM